MVKVVVVVVESWEYRCILGNLVDLNSFYPFSFFLFLASLQVKLGRL